MAAGRRVTVFFFVLLAGALASGCEAGSEAGSTTSAGAAAGAVELAGEPLAAGHTARCGSAALGGSDDGWRRLSAHAGPFGFYGYGRAFASRFVSSNFLGGKEVKLPVVVEGQKRVIVSISRGDRARAQLHYGWREPQSRLAFEPCPGRAATTWPGAIRIDETDRSRPVSVRIEVEGETRPRTLEVGEVSRAEFDRLGS